MPVSVTQAIALTTYNQLTASTATFGGVIGTAALDAVTHRPDTLVDASNGFVIAPDEASDLQKKYLKENEKIAALYVIPLRAEGMVSGHIIAEVYADGTLKPYGHPLAKNGVISVDLQGQVWDPEYARHQSDFIMQQSEFSEMRDTTNRAEMLSVDDIFESVAANARMTGMTGVPQPGTGSP